MVNDYVSFSFRLRIFVTRLYIDVSLLQIRHVRIYPDFQNNAIDIDNGEKKRSY